MCLIQTSSREGWKDDSKAVEEKAQQRTAVESEDFMPAEAVRAESIAHIIIIYLASTKEERENVSVKKKKRR